MPQFGDNVKQMPGFALQPVPVIVLTDVQVVVAKAACWIENADATATMKRQLINLFADFLLIIEMPLIYCDAVASPPPIIPPTNYEKQLTDAALICYGCCSRF
jgi:hypothetical protein